MAIIVSLLSLITVTCKLLVLLLGVEEDVAKGGVTSGKTLVYGRSFCGGGLVRGTSILS